MVLEKANGGISGYWEKATLLKKYNPDIKILYYWNSRIYFGHNGVDDSIEDKRDEYINPKFVIRGGCPPSSWKILSSSPGGLVCVTK